MVKWKDGGRALHTQVKVETNSLELACGFCDVGIKLKDVDGENWTQTQDRLKVDIVIAFKKHALHMLCLSELGEQGIGLGSKLQDHSVTLLLSCLLDGTVVSPFVVYNASNLAAIVKDTRVIEIMHYQVVKDFIS